MTHEAVEYKPINLDQVDQTSPEVMTRLVGRIDKAVDLLGVKKAPNGHSARVLGMAQNLH